jgi:hypothetical protein
LRGKYIKAGKKPCPLLCTPFIAFVRTHHLRIGRIIATVARRDIIWWPDWLVDFIPQFQLEAAHPMSVNPRPSRDSTSLCVCTNTRGPTCFVLWLQYEVYGSDLDTNYCPSRVCGPWNLSGLRPKCSLAATLPAAHRDCAMPPDSHEGKPFQTTFFLPKTASSMLLSFQIPTNPTPLKPG